MVVIFTVIKRCKQASVLHWISGKTKCARDMHWNSAQALKKKKKKEIVTCYNIKEP